MTQSVMLEAVPRPTGPDDKENAMKTAELFTVWAETNQQMLQTLVDLSATSVKESARLYAELQYGALDAVRDGQAFWLKRQAEIQDAQGDPVAWSQRAVAVSVEGTQRVFQLME